MTLTFIFYEYSFLTKVSNFTFETQYLSYHYDLHCGDFHNDISADIKLFQFFKRVLISIL